MFKFHLIAIGLNYHLLNKLFQLVENNNNKTIIYIIIIFLILKKNMHVIYYATVLKIFIRGKICYKKYSEKGIKNSGFIMNIVSIGACITTAFIIWGESRFFIFKSLKQLIKPLIFLSVTLNTVSDTLDNQFRFYSAFI